MTTGQLLPMPTFFDPTRVGEVWRVPYQQRVWDARAWAKQHNVDPSASDTTRTCLLLVDVQNTFCIPGHELFVGGHSGMGAVEDNVRLCEFIYRNLGSITEIAATMDTHTVMQIFHPFFWVDEDGNNPPPMTMISHKEVEQGKWTVNPALISAVTWEFAPSIPYGDHEALQNYAIHYVRTLNLDSKYPLTIWPYHSMLGGIGHALVSAVEEACFFHTIARQSQTYFEVKGGNPLTENYSVLKPEVLKDQGDRPIAQKNTRFTDKLLNFDKIIIAGQAKSHCVAWTIDDLLSEIQARDPALAQKVYLLEDCTSPVVVPDVVDFTDQADSAFQRFSDAGMHRVTSSNAIAP